MACCLTLLKGGLTPAAERIMSDQAPLYIGLSSIILPEDFPFFCYFLNKICNSLTP